MAPKTKIARDARPGRRGASTEERDRLLHSGREQAIRRRAFEIFMERGTEPGHELQDWLQAERELTANQSNSPGE